jgi:protein-S-isoprenylcysteine O-methyltransferase Ste14
MAADYRDNETLTPRTVAVTFSALLANAGAYALALRRRTWPLPLRARPAMVGGATVAGALATRAGRYRNPRYLTLDAALAGIGVATRSGLACAIAATAWAVAQQPLPTDERHLARMFGDQHSP